MTLPVTESLLHRLGWDDGWEAAFAEPPRRRARARPRRDPAQGRLRPHATRHGERARERRQPPRARATACPPSATGSASTRRPNLIEALLPRRTSISRKEVWHATQEQILAANVDVAFLVQALPLDFNVRRLERYLAMAWESGAQPVVLLTKTDLVDDVDAVPRRGRGGHARLVPGACASRRAPATASTSCAPGSSGTARPSCSARRASASRRSSTRSPARSCSRRRRCARTTRRGRHTTTHRELILLPTGGVVLDTPGIRELQLWDADLEQTFGDVEEIARRCRFSDCAHDQEPGCAIREALADGSLLARALGELLEAAARAGGDRGAPQPPTATGTRPGVQDPRTAQNDRRRNAEPAPRPRGRGGVRAARPRAPLRRGGARAGGRAPAARAAVRRGATARGGSTFRAARGRPARVPARRRRRVRPRPGQPAARRRPVRRQVGRRVARVRSRPPGSTRSPTRGRSRRSSFAAAASSRASTSCSTRRPSRPASDAPLLVVHDGPEYAEYAGLTRFLDAMSWEERIPPLRAALIQPVDRNETYSASALYAGALVRELLPEIAKRAPHGHRIGMGASLGALAMLHAHVRHPKSFDGLLLQSGSFFRQRYDKHESRFPALPADHALRRDGAARRATASGRFPSRSPAARPRRTARTTRRSRRRSPSRATRPGSPRCATGTPGRAGATRSTRTCPR